MAKRTMRARAEWEALVRDQIESGKPAVQWCQDNCVPYKSLVRWRCKLNRESVGSVTGSVQPAAGSPDKRPWPSRNRRRQ